jgi:hypothetical protein
MRSLIVLIVLLFIAAAANAAGLDPLAPLVGTWRGTTSGQPGQGTSERDCRRILSDRFIECRHTATYPPQERNKKGEVHTDLTIFSYDKALKKIRMRQFHVEGFVNTFTETEPLVFITDAIENIPAGWRASETYVLTENEWRETFSLAEPGKDFAVYSTSTLARVK